MADWTDGDAAMELLEKERKRLSELSRIWKEESTTIRSKDRSLAMTFDGRGELTDIAFNGSKYRTIAPAELTHLLLETYRMGRAQSMEKMTAAVASDAFPGIDVTGLATGKVDPNEMLDAIVKPMLGDLADDGVLGRSGGRRG